MRLVVVFVCGVFACGCQTPLDIRQAELIQSWGEGNRTFCVVMDEYRGVVDRVAGGYHQSQRELRNRQWQAWLDRHTQEDGSLVSADQDGGIRPMTAEQLQAALAERDAASETIAQSERTWQQVDAKIKKAVEDFRLMTELAMQTNTDIAEAKKSAQQFAESALGALAGLAGGIGLGAAVVP